MLERLHAHRQRNLMLMVQTSCNLACDYCYEVRSGFHHTGGRMSFEMAKASIDEYLERTGEREAVTVTFFGGEPLLNMEVVRKSVAYGQERAAELGKKIGFSMTTNGTLLNAAIIAFLVENEFIMMVSLDGAPEKADVRRHDLRGGGATSKALEGALALLHAQREAGVPELSVRATLTRENPSQREAYDFFYRAGFRRIVISSAGSREDVGEPWLLDQEAHAANAKDHETLLERYVEWAQGGEDFPQRLQLERGLQSVQRGLDDPKIPASINCGVGNNMLATTGDGKMYPCHRFAGEEAHVLGHVNKGGVDQERLHRFYEDVLNAQDEVCSGCWARFVCSRPCPWTFSKEGGGMGSISNQTCDRIRQRPREIPVGMRQDGGSEEPGEGYDDSTPREVPVMSNHQEPEPTDTLGIAGQKIHRRKLMTMVAAGFVVLSVGARNRVRASTLSEKRKQAYACGEYVLGNLTGDVSCGVGGSRDVSCGDPITQGGGSQVGADYACGAMSDSDCGTRAPAPTRTPTRTAPRQGPTTRAACPARRAANPSKTPDGSV